MLRALKAFSHAGVEVVAGQEVEPYTFEADDVQGLIRKGLLEDTNAKKADKPKDEKKPPAKETAKEGKK